MDLIGGREAATLKSRLISFFLWLLTALSGEQKDGSLEDQLENVMVGFWQWEWIEKADTGDILEEELTGPGDNWF